jgi:4,5-DOPA dioxygenase extradiol
MAIHPRVLLVPHYPALILDQERGVDGSIAVALAEIGRQYRREESQVVVILSAAWEEEGPFQVDSGARHKTLLDMDGVEVALRYSCDGWTDLALALQENGNSNGLPVEAVHRGMDHGSSVPLSLLFPEADMRVVPLATAKRSREDLRWWGEVVRETCRGAGASCVILVGGSLSYDAEAARRGEDHRAGIEVDRRVLRALEEGDWDGIRDLPEELRAAARVQGDLRHLWFLEGVTGGGAAARVHAYQRHPSVGSALVEFQLAGD